MKSTKQYREFIGKPLPELARALVEQRDRLWQLKSDLAAGKVKNVAEIRRVKRMIARLLFLVGIEKAKTQTP